MKVRTPLGTLLRRIRRARELSQAQVSEYLGLSRTGICDIEAGRRSISSERLALLLDFYEADDLTRLEVLRTAGASHG